VAAVLAVFAAVVTVAGVTEAPNEAAAPQQYEWRASTFAPSAQEEVALAVTRDDELIAVWSSRRQQEGHYSVYAQRFTAEGCALGYETPVCLWGQSHQSAADIVSDPLGGVWVVWQSHGQDGHAGAIIARHLDADLRGGSEVLVNQEWRGHQSNPVADCRADGSVLVAWTSQVGTPSGHTVRARLIARDGTPLTDEFAVGRETGRYETTPAAAFRDDGSFAVAFSMFDDQMRPAGVRMQRFAADGTRAGDELCVSTAKNAIEPVIEATPEGFVVAWVEAGADGGAYGVVARRCAIDGTPISEPFCVSREVTGPQNAPALAVGPDGGFTVAWNQSDGDELGVFARRFSPGGTALGSELRLSKSIRAMQALRAAAATQRLAYTDEGRLVCGWSGDSGLGDASAANMSMVSALPLDVKGKVQGITAGMPAAGSATVIAGVAEPHRPPTFDPNAVDFAERELDLRGPDIGFTGIVNTGWTPPDPHLAVGPSHVVVMTNGAIAFFQKDGTLDFQDEIEDSYGFWGSVGASGFVFDPEVLYDELSGRFFAMAAEAYAPGSRSYALVAVSDDSDPNGTWYKYRFDTTGLAGDLFDSPNIGVDANVVYITGDGFGMGANYPVYTFDKASLLAGSPPAIQRSTTLSTSTQSAGIPAVSYDSPPALYMIEHRESASNNSVRLIALRNPLGTPNFTTTTLNVPVYSPPTDPPQLGSSVRPETFDARFWSVAYRNGSLWATHHVGSSRVLARWYEIAMNGWPDSGQQPSLVQSGDIDPGAGIHTFFCSITVADNGTAAMTYARSATNEYISMGTAYRFPNTDLGMMLGVTTQKVSTGPYNYASRWGDYSEVEVDPADGVTFWAHHEYGVGNSWRTWVAGLVLVSPLGDMNCDGLFNNADIPYFVMALTDVDVWQAAVGPSCDLLTVGDIDGDGSFNNADIPAFVDLLAGA